MKIRKDFSKGVFLEQIDCYTILFFIQVSTLYVAFSSGFTLRKLLTVWRGHQFFSKKLLIKFSFGSSIIRWISRISTFYYCSIKSCVSVNGQYSEWFRVQRSTRQGDPYLFLICGEIMSIMIRQSNSIQGIIIGDEEILLSVFVERAPFYL